MSKYLKIIDIFGNSFSFTTFQQEKFKTSIGGFFSFICIIIAIVFSFLFGQDFFYRSNPKVRSQKVIPEMAEKINLSRDVLALPWRIEDDSGIPVNFEGLIYPKLFYFFYDYNEQNQLTLSKKVTFNLTKCNDEIVKFPQLQKQLNLSNYYCWDWEGSAQNFTYGGFWDTSFAHYFEINFEFCKERSFSKSNTCTSLEQLKSYFSSNNPWYFSTFYPQYTFRNEDLDEPLRLVFKNYYYQFNLNSQKTDRWKFKKVILDDDQGWILQSNKNTSLISFDRIESDYSLALDSELTKEGSKSAFYKTVFYLEKDFDLFNRSFMKIQDLAAVVGGFLKILVVIFGFVSNFFNRKFKKIHLFYEMFDCDFLSQSLDTNNYNKKFSNSYIKNFPSKISNINTMKKNTHTNNDFHSQVQELNIPSRISIAGISEKKINLFKNSNLPIVSQMQMNEHVNIKGIKPFTDLNINGDSSSLDRDRNREKNLSNFGLLFLIKKSICTGTLSPRERQFDEILLSSEKYYNNRLDIVTYIRTLESFDKIKYLLLNDYQKNSLDFTQKPNTKDLESLEFENNSEYMQSQNKLKIREIVEYYNNIFKTESFSSIDKKLLSMLREDIQRQIITNN